MSISLANFHGLLIHGDPSLGQFRSLVGPAWRGRVYVAEGRPTLRAARHTTRALLEGGFAPLLIADNMVAYCMSRGLVEAAVVTYWRTAAEGLSCPVGALGIAICAAFHRVPVVAVPAVEAQPPEVRAQDLFELQGHRVAPDGADAFVPAADLVAPAWISEIRDRSWPPPAQREGDRR